MQLDQPQQNISPRRVLSGIIALVVFFILITSVISVAGKYITMRGHIRDLKEQKQELQTKAMDLDAQNAYMDTEEGKEQALRDKYNVVKPGEGIVIVTTEEQPSEKTVSEKGISHVWHAILRGLGFEKE